MKPVPWAEYETEGGPWRLALALERLPLPPPWLEAVAASWPLLGPPGAASNATTYPAGIPLGEGEQMVSGERQSGREPRSALPGRL